MTGNVVNLAGQRRTARAIALIAGGGGVHDDGMPPSLSARVDRLESDIAEIKGDVKSLTGDVRHLSTDLAEVNGRVLSLSGDVRHLSTDLAEVNGRVLSLTGDVQHLAIDLAEVKGRVSMMPTTFHITTWFVGVSIGLVGLVFAIARLVR